MSGQLAQDLRTAKDVAQDHIIQSRKLPRMVLQRLKKMGWLSEIMKGWYILKTPQAEDGESTLWYANFWAFLKYYLDENYQDGHCLGPQSSLYLKTESGTIPEQVVLMLRKGGNFTLNLPFGTSVLFYQEKNNFPKEIERWNGLNIIPLPKALTMIPENFFANFEVEAEIALNMVRSPSELTKYLMDNHQPVKAEILAGAYDFLKKDHFVEQIKKDMGLVGYTVKPKNPFIKEKPSLSVSRIESPAIMRVELLWSKYRDTIIEQFPEPKKVASKVNEVMASVKQIYVHDAYNSLSIEGYAVTEELIEKVANGTFDAELNSSDKQQELAMAAKGYYLAFTEVTKFIEINFGKKTKDIKLKDEVQNWYQQLFIPKVHAGLAPPSLLVGYRGKPVYIRNSKHTPVNFSFVNEVMDKYLELIDKEESPKARAILAHFMLVYIHPFPDGNGRTSRFIMNAILTLSGYNWTVIQLENRDRYFKALEKAATSGDIKEFVDFVAEELHISERRAK